MGLDAVCMTALAHELRAALLGGKVDKVFQPGPSEVILAMRGNRENVKLLLCAQPGAARAHLTGVERENPAQPPVFCMLLRKHLTAARLVDVVQPRGERILRFVFSHVNELGDAETRNLILEAMGSRTNLILTDQEDRVLAVTRREEGDLAAGKRQVMPGLFYQPPEPRPGVPALLERELEFRGKETPEEGVARLEREVSQGQYAPTMLLRDGKPFDFSFLPILQYGPQVELAAYPAFSKLLDAYYAQRPSPGGADPRKGELLRTVKTLRDRTARKVANQERELSAARDREGLRLRGDLLTANLYRLQRGMTKATVENYYDPGTTLDIPLDPLLTPQQNAARYYKDYARAKTAETVLTGQIEKGREELTYLESVLEGVNLSQGERDLGEIRAELEDAGFLRRRKGGKKVMKQGVRPLEFTTSAGLRVSVGKNNTQNDYLTCKKAGREDWWFHVQKHHGAHVILWTDGESPDEESLTEAAALAAWYSQARESDKAAVDYTQVKYVKKPAGARPGMVVYTVYQTAWVKPMERPPKKE